MSKSCEESDSSNDLSLILEIKAVSVPGYQVSQLVIRKHSETVYFVTFEVDDESISADMDCVQIDVKESLIIFKEPETSDRVFHIPDRGHLQLFQQAQLDCQEICNLFLELSSRFRDIYYAAVYTKLKPSDTLSLDEELEKLQSSSLAALERDIAIESNKDRRGSSSSSAGRGGHSHSAGSSTPATASHHSHAAVSTLDLICCFYCGVDGRDEGCELFGHPYVPLWPGKKNRRLLFCQRCLDNWRLYRETASLEQQLLLEGEVNEEVCALCSDAPDELILCGQCQRSYCPTCLQRLVGTTALYKEALATPNWQCACCEHRVTARPLLAKEHWTSWRQLKIAEAAEKANKTAAVVASVAALSSSERSSAVHLPTKMKNAGPSTSSSLAATSQFGKGRAAIKPQSSPQSNSGSQRNSKGQFNPKDGRSKGDSTNSKQQQPLSPRRQPHPSAAAPAKNSMGKGRGKPNVNRRPGEDEVFYFALYVQAIEAQAGRWQQQKNKGPQPVGSRSRAPLLTEATDDTCFLCKDGGDVVECDYMHGQGRRCLKVFHQYCLAFEVADNVKNWHCPRHFCSSCGSRVVKLSCAFCPLSLCGSTECHAAFAERYQRASYHLLEGEEIRGPLPDEISIMVCEACAGMMKAAEGREGLLLPPADEQQMDTNDNSRRIFTCLPCSPPLLFTNNNGKLFVKEEEGAQSSTTGSKRNRPNKKLNASSSKRVRLSAGERGQGSKANTDDSVSGLDSGQEDDFACLEEDLEQTEIMEPNSSGVCIPASVEEGLASEQRVSPVQLMANQDNEQQQEPAVDHEEDEKEDDEALSAARAMMLLQPIASEPSTNL